MAEKTFYVDDLDEKTTEGVQTVRFAYKGYDYEIDLSEAHREELDKALEKYLEKGRQPKAPRTVSRSAASDAPRRVQTMKYSSETMAEATAWAKTDEGAAALKDAKVEYSGVGRTPYSVVEEFLKTQS